LSLDVIRPATDADLSRVAGIWYEAVASDDRDAPALQAIPSLYVHELETHELFVLERNERVAGFAAMINRGRVAFLADLFVAADSRSSGIGQQLLRHVMPTDGRTCCTVSSSDPRALALYVRFGMRPYWTNVQLLAESAALEMPAAVSLPDVEVIEASAEDPEWARWDTEISGRGRPRDQAYWLWRRGGRPLWFAQHGRILGYGLAQTVSDDLLGSTDAITLGPIGARRSGDAVACTLAAVNWGRERGTTLRVSVTGPHPAMPSLLTAGFRIVEVGTFCLRAEQPFVDVERYISSGSDLF
jgi:GNAT superfamily N-acetyltransferase